MHDGQTRSNGRRLGVQLCPRAEQRARLRGELQACRVLGDSAARLHDERHLLREVCFATLTVREHARQAAFVPDRCDIREWSADVLDLGVRLNVRDAPRNRALGSLRIRGPPDARRLRHAHRRDQRRKRTKLVCVSLTDFREDRSAHGGLVLTQTILLLHFEIRDCALERRVICER